MLVGHACFKGGALPGGRVPGKRATAFPSMPCCPACCQPRQVRLDQQELDSAGPELSLLLMQTNCQPVSAALVTCACTRSSTIPSGTLFGLSDASLASQAEEQD